MNGEMVNVIIPPKTPTPAANIHPPPSLALRACLKRSDSRDTLGR